MDYEQKYKTLVNAVMELQKANPSDEGIQNWVNENVPELAGNKDERIKKYLISFIKLESGVNLPLDDAGKILAWLEKQDEQKPTWKPSGEQMEALKSSTFCQDKQMSKVLFELYQDLKKLREE